MGRILESIDQKRATSYFIIAVLLIAAIIRFYFIHTYPAQPDEIKIIEETMRLRLDAIPVQLVGFGGGEYLLLPMLSWPFINLLQLDPLNVTRTIVLISSLLFIVNLFYLTRRIMGLKTALVAIFFAAIWPWSIAAGSTGYNFFLVPFIFTLVILLFLRYIDTEKSPPLYVAFLLLGISLYTYPLCFVWTVLLFVAFSVMYRDKFFTRQVVFGCIGMIILSLPVTLFYLNNQFNIPIPSQILFFRFPRLIFPRFTEISIFTNARWFMVPIFFFGNYLTHFHFLLLTYVPLRTRGFYYLSFFWDIAFMYMGIFFMMKAPDRKKYTGVILWLLFFPIGSSMTENYFGYAASRDIVGLPVLLMLSAFGFVKMCEFIRGFIRHKKTPSSAIRFDELSDRATV